MSKIIAILLLLIFSEKGLLPLWIHHWFHESKPIAGRTTIPTSSDTFHLACDCFNQAMLPFEESAFFTLSIPVQKATELANAPQIARPDAEKIYYSLKGPPAPSAHS